MTFVAIAAKGVVVVVIVAAAVVFTSFSRGWLSTSLVVFLSSDVWWFCREVPC